MAWQTLLTALGLSRSAPGRRLPDGSPRANSGKTAAQHDHGPAFTIAVVSLCAKMSKADGISMPIEVDAFERLFQFAPSEMPHVRSVFDRARKDVAGFESYARTIATELADEPELKLAVFDALFIIAAADGVVHEAENRFLERVAEIFGYTPAEFRAIRARFVNDADDPYTILAIAHTATNEQLKARYRQLARDNHPDLLAARGVPAKFVEIAQQKLAVINAAYDRIARERGL